MKPLKIKYNDFIPFDGFFAITLFGCIFIRNKNKNRKVSATTYNHESIHQAQAYDFGIGFAGYFIFYLLYALEWLLKLLPCLFTGNGAYRSISFEQEAYTYQGNLTYLEARKRFKWLSYIFKLTKR